MKKVVVIFRRKNFFERKIFNSVVGVFFLSLKLPMTRKVQACRVGVLYKTSVGCYRGSEAGGGGFKSRYQPHFLRVFRYSMTRSYFSTTKIMVSGQKFRVFCKWAFFLENDPFSDVTETDGFFQNFWKSWEEVFDFPDKTKKKFKRYKCVKTFVKFQL